MIRLPFSTAAYTAAAIALAAAAPLAAWAAVPPDKLPAPGLYRIDSVSQLASRDGAVRRDIGEDGASGNTDIRTQVNGAATRQHYPGAAPVTRCVQPQAGPAAYAMPAAAGCSAQSTQALQEGVVHTALCNGLKTTVTIRKLGDDSWDVVTKVSGAPGGAPPGLEGLRPLLEHAAKNAPTADERAKAASQLAQLPAMQAQMSAQRRQVAENMRQALAQAKSPEEKAALQGALAQLGGDATAMPDAERRERWTRIGATCRAGTGQPPGR